MTSPFGIEDAALDQEAPISVPKPSLFNRLQKYAHRRMPALVTNPDVRKILWDARSDDQEENAKSEPPRDELIEVQCIWAAEFYTPSHMPNLQHSFKKLGWNSDDPRIGTVNPLLWIQRLRASAHGGGHLSLGLICRPGDPKYRHHRRSAPLPPEIDCALATMYSMTSSITCIVIGLILNEEYTVCLDQALRRKHQTLLKRLPGGGYRFLEPPSQKAADVRSVRSDIRRLATDWFRTHLPGAFASGLLAGEFPTCEFLTLRKTTPFPSRNERAGSAEEWLRLLDADSDLKAWRSDRLPALKFAWPLLRDPDGSLHAVMACRKDDFSADEFSDGRGRSRISSVAHFDRHVSGLISRWGLLGVLYGFERHLTHVRDSAIFDQNQRTNPTQVLEVFRNHIAQGIDIWPLSAESGRFAAQNFRFEYNFPVFKRCDPSIYRDDVTLADFLREEISERSKWLDNVDRSLRDIMIQYGAVLGARVNISQTKVMLLLTIIVLMLTAMTTWIAYKTADISWPW